MTAGASPQSVLHAFAHSQQGSAAGAGAGSGAVTPGVGSDGWTVADGSDEPCATTWPGVGLTAAHDSRGAGRAFGAIPGFCNP